jgi:hypothetical protein
MANGGFDDIFAELTSVNAEVVLLSERVTVLEEAQPAGPGGTDGDAEKERPAGAPIVWDDLDDDEYAVLWPQFVRWVIRTADRCELTTDQLPRQCWWLHGAVVDELTALWTGHQSAYTAAGEDAGSAPYLWQDAFARVIERIGRTWLGTCRNGQHKKRHREMWAGDDQYLTTLLHAGRSRRGGDASGDTPGGYEHGPDTPDSP